MSNHKKRLSGVSLAALAMLGISRPATAEEASITSAPDGFPNDFKTVESIKDFNSVTTNADGSIDVVLETGETVTFKASEIAFVNGQVFVTEAAITEAGLFLASAGFSISTPVLVAGAAALAGGAAAIAKSGGDSNDAPNFSSPTSFSVSENQTSAFSATATDSDGDTVTYSLSGTDAGLFSINASNGVVTFNSTPDFENPADGNGDNVFQVTVTATDGSETITQAVNVTVTNENETPVITSVTNATVDENQTAAFTATATDVDGDTLTYTLSGDDAALFAIDAATGVVTFLDAPDFETPGDADGDNVYNVTVTAGDGTLSSAQDVAITVSDVNEAPLVTSGPSFTAAENQTAAFIATATDVDGDTLTYTLSGDDAALFAIDSETGVVTFLNAPDFETPGDEDGDNVYDVTVTASDGELSAAQDVAITVSDENEAPQISTGATFSVNEGSVSIFTAAATDPDGDALTYSLTGTDAASFAINAVTGDVVFVGVPDFEIPADEGGNNIYDVTLSVTDGEIVSEQAIQVAVLDTEDLLVEGSSLDDVLDLSTQTEAAVVESGSGNDAVTSGVGSDTISSGDGDDIINPGAGADVIAAGDGNDIVVIIGRTDENEYSNENILNPAGTGVDVSSVTTVANINAQADDDSAPGEILSGGAGSDTVVVYGETNLSSTNLTGFERLILNSDVTLSGEQLTAFTNALGIQGDGTSIVRIVNTDGVSEVNLDNVSGLAFVEVGAEISLMLTTAELSALQDSGLDAIGGPGQLIVPDASGLDLSGLTITSDLQIIDGASNVPLDAEALGATITVDNIDPVIIQTQSSVEFAENGAAVAYTAVAISADNGVSTYSLSGTDAALFSIDSVTGDVAFLATPDFEAAGDSDSDNSYDLIVTATDGVDTSDQAISIYVTDENEAPVLTSGSGFAAAENQTTVFTATATDIEGNSLSYSLSGDDASLFAIDAATGVVTFLDNPDFEAPGDADGDNVYDFTVNASDGALSSAQDVAITVSDVNDAPIIVSGSSFSANENQTATFTATAADFDGDTLTYTLSGDDAALFAINAATGVVTFLETPDFEMPGDTDGDNVYDLTITASDGELSAVSDVAVTVADIDDTPPDAPFILSVGLVNQFVPNADGSAGVFQFLPAITGTAEAGSTVEIFDGALSLGTTIAQVDGSFFFATSITSVSGELLAATATDAAGNASEVGTFNSLFGFNPSGYFAENNAPQVTIDGISPDSGFVISDSNGQLLSPDVSNAGDLNNDGFDDIIIGSSSYGINGEFSGQAAVIFGGEDGFGEIVDGQAIVDISTLLPADGFIIAGEAEGDFLRNLSSVGDFNGDGIDDILLGAPGNDLSSSSAGASYLIFGSNGEFGETDAETGRQVLELANLTADIGIVFLPGNDEPGSFGGADSSETAGDINGDGLNDLVFGDQSFSDSGSAFVVYGTTDAIGEIGVDGRQVVTVSALTPDQGFTITIEEGGGLIGYRVNSVGDVNNDGLDDFFVNALFFDDEVTPFLQGSSFIVFGSEDLLGTENADGVAVLNLNDFSALDGVRVIGSDLDVTADAVSMSSIGDFNGDGLDDLLIGSPDFFNGGNGEAHIVFGREDGIGTDDGNGNLILDLSTLTADTGIVLSGRSGERTGFYSTGIDDFNNDGFADVIVGSAGFNNDGSPGSAFIVYGGADVGVINEDNQRIVDLPDLTALQGFEIRGQEDFDNLGFALSTAGDINSDGLPDIIVNTLDTVTGPASAVVIFGGQSPIGESETLALVAENTTAAFVATSLGEGTIFTLGGDDAELFEINQETGLVSFIDAPDFETILTDERFTEILEYIDDPEDLEDFGFDLEILATNGDISAVQEVAITVTDVNEFAPEFTVDQNLTTSNGRYFILAEDPDGTPIAIADVGVDGGILFDDALTYEITGGVDAALFEIELRDGNSGFAGRLTFIDEPDVDAPMDTNGDGVYEVEISISDGELVTAQTFNLSVVEGGADPVVTSPVNFTVDEHSESLIGQIVGEDPDGAGVNYSLNFSADRDLFDINFFTGELSFIGETVPSFANALDENGDNTYDLNVRVTDGADTIVQTVTVTVNDVEFAPSILGGTEFRITENNFAGEFSSVAFFVAQDLDLEVISATITGGEDSALFTIRTEFTNFEGDSGFSLATDQVFDFEVPADANGDNTYEIEVTLSDGLNQTVELIELSILDVFESPNAPIFTTPETITVDEGPNFTFTINADDADGETLTYSITGGDDQFDFYINQTTGELQFFGDLRFNQPSDFNDNVYTLEITADDGTNNQTVQILTINVEDIDVAPTLSVNSANVVSENDSNVFFGVDAFENFDGQFITLSLGNGDVDAFNFDVLYESNGYAYGQIQFLSADFENPTDADGDNVYEIEVIASDGVNTVTEILSVTVEDVFESLNAPVFVSSDTVTVDEGVASILFVSATDADGETPTYSITGGDEGFRFFNIDAVTGELTFNSPPRFEADTQFFDNIYEVEVSADDGSGNVVSQLIAVELVDVDVAPSLSVPTSREVFENNVANFFVSASNDYEDQPLTITLSGPDAAAFIFDGPTSDPSFIQGRLEFAQALDFENPTDANGDNIYVVEVNVSDGVNLVTETISFTIIDVFESPNAPIFTTPDAFTVEEGNDLRVTISATDDDGDVLTYSITDSSNPFFSIDSATGLLESTFLLDFDETGQTFEDSYTIEVTADDGTGNQTVQTITVNTEDADVAPTISLSGDLGPGEFSLNENTSFLTGIFASDNFDEQELSVSIEGEDAALFSYQSNHSVPGQNFGTLSLLSSLDFENPTDADGDNVYIVDVIASDGVNTTTETISITVLDVEEIGSPPEFTSPSDVSINEDETFVVSLAASDVDGDNVTFSVTGGDDQSEFFIGGTNNDELTFLGVNFSDFDGDGVYEVVITADDGNSNTVTQSLSITINDVNFSPDLFASIGYTEENTVTTDVVIEGYDFRDNDLLTVTLSGDDAAFFSIVSTLDGPGNFNGTIVFNDAPDFETPLDANGDNIYGVTVELSDGVNTVTQDIEILVDDVPENGLPTLIVADGTTTENDVVTGVSFTGEDIDGFGGLLTVTLSGTDAGLFTLTGNTSDPSSVFGDIEFITAPDFEAPTDGDGDGVYEITVELTDGVNTVTQDITITVEDDDTEAGTVKASQDSDQDSLGLNGENEANETLASFSVEDDGIINLTDDRDVGLINTRSEIFDVSAETMTLTPDLEEQVVFEEDAAALEMQFAADLLMLQDSAMIADG